MKNLQVLYQTNVKLEESGKILVINGNESSSVFICSEEYLFSYNHCSDSLTMLGKIFGIMSCEHLSINDSVCIATELGEVHVLNLTSKEIEEVTFCEGGIAKMSWSPDQEIVVFVTKSMKVVVMTCMYDVINEDFLTEDRFGDGVFITVGWGKKETQFHGSEGKQAAKEKAEFVPDDTKELPQDINITWRGDGELFAVSFVGVFGRMFKVFDKEGQLRFTSEKVNNLTPHIAWKPSGSWIAVPQSFPNKNTIALFEKNGLRHREIVLPFKFDEEPVVHLSWSADSHILAIATLKANRGCLYLYTMSNYHWYLKQFLIFEYPVVDIKWDYSLNEEETLHVLLSDGFYKVYRWFYSVTTSYGNTIHNQVIINVIDGSNLLITDLRNRVIPPPFCGLKLKTNAHINATGYICNPIKPEDHNKFFVLNSNNELMFYKIEFKDTNLKNVLKAVHLKRSIKLSDAPNHLLWLNNNHILFCVSENSKTIIKVCNILENSLEDVNSITIDQHVCSMTSADSLQAFLQVKSGQIFILKLKDGKLVEQKLFKLHEVCETLKTFKTNKNFNLVSLSYNHNLFVNFENRFVDVTSFCLTKNHLVFTQLTKLMFVRLNDLKVVSDRKIERGAKLITDVPLDSKLILQMPRGNLETINPPVLSLEIVGDYLEKLMYRKAMNTLRKQRINLNILCDHNLKTFVNNLDKFVDEISNPQWLNLFLTDLQNEDFTKTLYASNYDDNSCDKYPENFEIGTKINFICEKLCKKMSEKDREYFILPIITSFVKIGALEKALGVIWTVKKKENTIPEESRLNISEEALKYIFCLVDVNELFKVALGTYDFGLVLFVASKSQKDPKEYIPFLNELKQYEINYYKFKIDVHIKRLDRALENISKCEHEKFVEALEFIKNNSLYWQALQLYENQNENYQKIAIAFADHLRSIGKFKDASLMYERGGDLTQAIRTSKHAYDWRRCISLTSILTNGNRNELKKIALSLLPALEENGKFDEAFEMVKMFVSDMELALNLLLKGNLYTKAICESKIENLSLYESKVIPSILKYKKFLVENICGDQNILNNHLTRLIAVRKINENNMSNEINENDNEECDLLSDTTSINSSRHTVSSIGTSKTFRSSKNRRKHERKLLSLKEGNPFEDIALIVVLYKHINKIVEQQLQIRETCISLIDISRDKEAKEVQTLFKSLLNLVKDSLEIIWIPEMMSTHQYRTELNLNYTQVLNEQRYSLLNPIMRFKPQLNYEHWELDILK